MVISIVVHELLELIISHPKLAFLHPVEMSGDFVLCFGVVMIIFGAEGYVSLFTVLMVLCIREKCPDI